MRAESVKSLRCAIYTRKSTEHGLELEFNSLDAQREACEAYIKSQASQGWQALPARYDDPAYSGGNLERPALKRLLADIEAGKVDTIVVYKIDRLTRSLADFAKLVETFDARSISFVAITQQFNTTTSMGRLTLNILLSFAQFERELSSERVRDKVAASRRKGKWTGGNVPLGYDVRDKKLVINEAEATHVRYIFKRYLELKSFGKLVNDLDKKQIVSKSRKGKSKRFEGGTRFTYGPLAHILKNRVYIGESGHKGKWFDGEQKPILDKDLFDRVQALIGEHSVRRRNRRSAQGALLTGKLFDDRGNRMSPTYSVKNGVRYRFYVSSALLRGRKADAGSVSRITAATIEDAVAAELRKLVPSNSNAVADHPELIEQLVERIELRATAITIQTKSADGNPAETIELEYPGNSIASQQNLNRSVDLEPGADPRLIQSVARAHGWMADLTTGVVESVEDLAKSAGIHPKLVRQTLRLAFLAPDVIQRMLQGASMPYPSEISARIALSWHEQRKTLFIQA